MVWRQFLPQGKMQKLRGLTHVLNKLLRKGSNCWCPDYKVGFDRFYKCYSTNLHFCFPEFLYTVHSNIIN